MVIFLFLFQFPQVGELILRRLVIQFRRGYKRNDKALCLSTTRFIAHLVNQQVVRMQNFFFVVCLFLKKSRANTHKKCDMHIQFYTDKRHLIYKNKTFCNTGPKFQTPRIVSNGNHFLHIYSFCVEDKKFMVVLSILIQYFRFFRPPFILGLSPKHLHLYK